MDTITLIKRCQLGDLESFEQLYKIYSKNALGTAYLIAGHKGIAEDIVQEAFFQCYKEIKGLRDPCAFDVWFYKLLTRMAWKMSSQHKFNISNEEINIEAEYNGSCLSPDLEVEENRLIVHQAISKLSPPLKTVVILYYFNDMTIKQIAMVLNCFQGTVKSRLHNAKKLLQKELNESIGEDIYKTMYMAKECKSNG
ncbi:MAG TPA: RNA polymerase sigma factor [Patescibacteria group bacterium]|nr:RNA polymerase sigma factor [Patescibacteria group bacterium]